MKTLLNVLAVALLALPLTLNAGTLPVASKSDMSATRSVAGWCYVYVGGRWWQVPC